MKCCLCKRSINPRKDRHFHATFCNYLTQTYKKLAHCAKCDTDATQMKLWAALYEAAEAKSAATRDLWEKQRILREQQNLALDTF